MAKMLAPLIASTLLGLASAQVTIAVPAIGFESTYTLGGSLVASGVDAVTLALGCLPSEPDCGVFPKHTIVWGPSTYKEDMSDPSPEADFTGSMDCVIASTTAVCNEFASGTEANFPGSSTETYSEIGTYVIEVTAGLEKFTEPASAGATPSAMGSATAVSGSTIPTLSARPSAASGSGSGSGSATASASQSSATPAQASTGAASGNVAVVGGGLLGVAAGVFGGLLL